MLATKRKGDGNMSKQIRFVIRCKARDLKTAIAAAYKATA